MPEAPDTGVLDVDGTLVETDHWHALARVRAFRRYCITGPWGACPAIGMGGGQLVGAAAGDDMDDVARDFRAAAWAGGPWLAGAPRRAGS